MIFHSRLFTLLIAGILMAGCVSRQTDQKPDDQDRAVPNGLSDAVVVQEKYLITANSVGLFRIGGPWQDVATEKYGYRSLQGYGRCEDACCDGGFQLGFRIIDGDYNKEMADMQLTIGAVMFSESQSEDEFTDSPGVFYSSSPNCSAWYWSDKISYIEVNSDLFRTKEDIGVGSTLSTMQEKFGKLIFYVGWIEEDANALQFTVAAYPNIRFILNVDDYRGNWENIDMKGEHNKLTPADFKSGTSILRLIVEAYR